MRKIEIKNKLRIVFCLTLLFAASTVFGQTQGVAPNMSFTVSMSEPNSHLYHVEFCCEGIKTDTIDFKMPAWTPGYYRVLNFAKNVREFSAADGSGKTLEWEKAADNIWRVKTAGADRIILNYDVFANGRSVAESLLNESRAFISPTSVFMYVAGRLDDPVTVNIVPHESFSRISTGLDRIRSRENFFLAVDFDTLYDCPIFVANQEVIPFEVRGIPHNMAIVNPGEFDREKLISILRRMIEAAASVVGEIPYRHYTFIMMGRGQGGLEHSNSMAVYTRLPNMDEPNDYGRWLSFITHEYFHLYNVKRIRPVALGPFDYDKENRTNMLWFAEGGTVYYEYIVLNRAGFMSRSDVLEEFGKSINGYESSPGNKTITVAKVSYDAWTMPFFGGGDKISYYDKGSGLCVLLDLKIRHESKNKKSLDDVMRILYQKYHKQLKRGFTDEEFAAECEAVAGCSLKEFFEYVYTTNAIDYKTYLGYAGLELDRPDENAENGRIRIKQLPEPDQLQAAILNSWLKQ
ncbi:MAG: M61 family metallopeptidase [Sedimentisphaerales bacterium]|nr:M61 family metallopeptidase [Sedimentisphaerales bacterium]